MSLDMFNDPTTIQTNLNITGPVGSTAHNARVNVVSGASMGGAVAESIRLHTNACVPATASVDGALGLNQRINVASTGANNCYWLPWGEGRCYIGTLQNAHHYFFTYKINGCGIIIGGSRAQPIIAHANLVSDRLTAIDNAQALRVQTEVYEQFYVGLAAQLQMNDFVTGRNVTVFTPKTYLAGAGFGAVFGVWAAGGWSFYGNFGGQTKKIWG